MLDTPIDGARRTFLKTAASAGVVGLAGCMGSDGETIISLAQPGSGTINGQSAQALQRAVRQESDSINVTNTETSGNPAAIQAYDNGEVDGCATENYAIDLAANDRAQFAEEPVSDVPPQVFSHTLLHWYWLAFEGSGLETTDDVFESDVDVYALPPAWGARQFQEEIHEQAGVWESIEDRTVDLEVDDVPGAADEGQFDAFIGYGSGYASLADWATEVDAREDVYVLETSDTLIEGIEAVDAAELEEIEPYGWDQDVGDSVASWTLPSQICVSQEIAAEDVYELCRVSYEHNDVVREALEAYHDHSSDIELMFEDLMEELPVHPGAAEFYEEHDVWDDTFTVAE